MKYIAALAVTFALLLVPMNGSAKCELCSKKCAADDIEVHVFADEHEHGLEYYEIELCADCVAGLE